MRAARLQASDLGHADMFFGSLLSNDAIKAQAKPIVEAPKPNGILFRTDSRTRFSDPPAPPPQQPLPEKPDVSRSLGFETSLPAQKRSLDRPQSLPSISPLPAESSSQIVSLVEALATAKKECEAQSARMRDLEEMLAQERQARAAAEELARMLESRSSESSDSEGLVSGAVTEMPRENHQTDGPLDTLTPMMDIDANAITKSTLEMEQRIEDMVSEMRDMKVQMDQFRLRAETAESERDANKKTLAQMVESIRLQESTRSMSAHKPEATTHIDNMPERGISPHDSSLLEKIGLANGHVHTPAVEPKGTLHFPLTGTLARSRDGRDALASQSAPYASAIGIVLIGMGLMAYLNGWQSPKVER